MHKTFLIEEITTMESYNRYNRKVYSLLSICFLISLIYLMHYMYAHTSDTYELVDPTIIENIGPKIKRPKLFSKTEDSWYHKTNVILKETNRRSLKGALYAPKKIKLQGSKYYSLSTFGPSEENYSIRVVIICGQHGREMITSEVCYHLIRLLKNEINIDSPFLTTLTMLERMNVGIWVVPVLNEHARYLIDEYPSMACTRKNSRDVDLNRNFLHPKWCSETPNRKDPKAVDFAGYDAMSEEETKSVHILLEDIKPHLLLNLHSGEKSILLPYDCSAIEVPPYYDMMVRIANSAKKRVCPECKVGSGSLILYKSGGTLTDYAVSISGVPLAYTLEIYGGKLANNKNITDSNATPQQCAEIFNPKRGKEYENVVSDSLELVLNIIQKVEQHANFL